MKYLFTQILCLTVGITVLCLCSCTDDIDVVQQHKIETATKTSFGVYPNSKNAVKSRSGNSFEENWENYTTYYLNNGTTRVDLPWRLAQSNNTFSDELGRDVKKEDGWTMLFHTLFYLEPSSNGNNYIFFYNQRTGNLKIFYYCTSAFPNNTNIWKLKCEQNQGLFKAVNDYAIPIGNYPGYEFVEAINPSDYSRHSLARGWNMIQIPLAYSPYNNPNESIHVNSYSLNRFEHTFLSEESSYSKGTITSIAATDADRIENSPLVKTTTSLIGKEAAKYITRNILPKTIFGLATSAIITPALVTSGITKIFNKFLGKNEKEESISELEIKTTTTGEIRGYSEFVTQGDIPDISFSLVPDSIGTELGAWNLSESPTIYIHPIGAYKPSQYSGDEHYYTFQSSGNYRANVVINPSLRSHIIRYWVTVDPVRYFHASDIVVNPVPSFDYGSLGGTGAYSNRECGTNSKITSNDCFYETIGKPGALYDDYYQADCYFVGLENKYGTKQNGTPYSYVYGPDNTNLIRGHMKYKGEDHLVRVNLHLITEFEGKRDTTVSTRTYFPKIEWDPTLMNRYRGMSMADLENYVPAVNDAIPMQQLQSNINGH